MSKNIKGYLLSETIIAIAAVATIITVVYSLSIGNYTKQNNALTKENTAEDLYLAKELRTFLYEKEEDYIQNFNNGYTPVNVSPDLHNFLNIKSIYLSEYNLTNVLNNEAINSQIKRSLYLKEDSNKNNCLYRYLVIYNDNSFSTLGIHCGEQSNGEIHTIILDPNNVRDMWSNYHNNLIRGNPTEKIYANSSNFSKGVFMTESEIISKNNPIILPVIEPIHYEHKTNNVIDYTYDEYYNFSGYYDESGKQCIDKDGNFKISPSEITSDTKFIARYDFSSTDPKYVQQPTTPTEPETKKPTVSCVKGSGYQYTCTCSGNGNKISEVEFKNFNSGNGKKTLGNTYEYSETKSCSFDYGPECYFSCTVKDSNGKSASDSVHVTPY